jgi:hypothetical protein
MLQLNAPMLLSRKYLRRHHLLSKSPSNVTLRELLADGIWHWTYDNGDDHVPILDDLMRHVDFCALQRYTEKRDQFYRAQVALPPKWEGINPNLALSCLQAEPTNTRHFIENAGRIWHKSFRYGTNRLKGLSNSDEAVTKAKCIHCDKVESPSHIYAQCRNPALRQQRERIFDSQTKALDRLRIDPTCPEWERRFFRRYHRLSFSHRHDRAEKSWNRTINPGVVGNPGNLPRDQVNF